MIPANSWLLLLFSLPTNRNTERVAVWRRLKKMGAVQIKTSTYLLPDTPAQYEQFQWLAQQIRDYGGDSTLVRAHEIEGLTKERVIAIFNDARAKDYGDLRKSLQSFIARQKKTDAEEAGSELERLMRRFREVRAVDFFDSPRGHDVAMLLRRAEGPKRPRELEKFDVKQYQGKTWLTRPRPEIDRVGSAWLIARFIDRKPKFVFASTLDAIPGAIPFDMLDAEFSHHGNYCTFETLTKRFAISDKSLVRIGEMIHDADLDDARFQRVEAVGIDRVLKGWAKEGLSDQEILRRGFECFDALYAFLRPR
ncbi:MAG TPA: chromate resistance protein ChrB domain-containing protein [Pyrinomonadaceae bacterium]|nr:chromate resistance protein ChrB domain-containing protein [Pyrinomonadaceae bacterium]